MDSASGRLRRIVRLRWWAVPALTGALLNASAATVASTLADDRVEASYNSGSDFVHDPAIDRTLARLGGRIQAADPQASCVSLRLHALDQPLPYSFVLKNGAFYVSTGLIARLQSEAELAALIALPLAALCRGDAEKLQADQHRRIVDNFVPNLLLVTLTAGFGAPAIAKANAKHSDEERVRLRDASDGVALRWLSAAGFDPAQAEAALSHLLAALAAEDRSGVPEFSNPNELRSRHDALSSALGQIHSDEGADHAAPSGKDALHPLARRYALSLALSDLSSHVSGLPSWLDYIDALDGPSGYTAYLRAEFAKSNSGPDAAVPGAIAAYEKCVTFPDAPPAAYRELGFLYRRAGDQAQAHKNFSIYLKKMPAAVDTPIIRNYLESP